MRKSILFLTIVALNLSCKSGVASKEATRTGPTVAYEMAKENREQGIYFRAVGNEPEWSLKISEKTIEFTSLKTGFESFNSVAVTPILAMDANVKIYQLTNNTGTATLQINQQDCINSMSGENALYSVQMEITIKNKTEKFSGCGNYVTDYRLHDIWVLEKLNGQVVRSADFTKELPNLQINSTTNEFLGFAGCNQMNGKVFYERGLLRFTNISTTRMMCAPNNKEADFLEALQNTTNYHFESRHLILSNPSGEKLVFKKVD